MAKKRKIAITGLSNAGKSVFLVSLLQHIQYSSPEEFDLQGRELRGFKPLPVKDDFFKQFPYEELLVELTAGKDVRGVWPTSTRDACKYSFRLFIRPAKAPVDGVPAWLRNKLPAWDDKYLFEFLDFPGERLADITIYAHENFADWSDAVNQSLKLYVQLSEEKKEYDAAINNIGAERAAGADRCAGRLATAYKKMLSAMRKKDIQMITPSSFLKETESGAEITDDELADNGKDRPCGIRGHDFVPLPPDFRKRRPDVAEKIAKNFDKYRDEAVKPLFDAVKDCERLLYLVDIPDILNGSDARHVDLTRLLEKIGATLNKRGWFERIVLSLFGRAKKILFVATKSDMVSRADQAHLASLTKELMAPLEKIMSSDVEFKVYAVSAWESTSPTRDPYRLNSMVLDEDLPDPTSRMPNFPTAMCALREKLKTVRDIEYTVSELPAGWPRQGWEKGDYNFPRQALYPLRLRTVAPGQHNLDAVFLALL